MRRPPNRWSRPFAAAVVIGSLLGACRTSDGPGRPVDPVAGAPCPDTHLLVGARATTYDRQDLLLRFDQDLQPCAGTILEADERLVSVGGMADGSELLGFVGRAARMRDGEIVWNVTSDETALQVLELEVEGEPRVAIVWGSEGASSHSASHLELLDADGTSLATFELDFDVVGAAASRPDRLILAQKYGGFREVVVDPSADALGGAEGLEAGAPRHAGVAWRVVSDGERVAMATDHGVLHWTPATPAMLGPSTCRGPRYVGGTYPADCTRWPSVAPDPRAEGRWLALCEGDEAHAGLVSLGSRDDCELVLRADGRPDHALVDAAWAGLPASD